MAASATRFNVGDKVRPRSNGQDKHRRVLAWSREVGVVVAAWHDGICQRVEVRWNNPDMRAFGTLMDSYLLALA